MSIAEIRNLVKKYPTFELQDVTFTIEEGKITGFIGRNGAGKTTTIKAMLNLIHPDQGSIAYFGKSFVDEEAEIKKHIGYSTGAVNWYPRKKIKEIVNVVKGFYDTWDEEAYQKYLALFHLDESKMPMELSEGMKVKANLLIALSHNTKVLILDEPTSGLDPFSRNELLDIFMELKKHGVAVFFSTHIISDIEKCADQIVYISKGEIIADLSKDDFMKKYAKDGENLEAVMLRMEGGIAHAEYTS